ncbi:unnamed protein product [Taenia asiatica]|uniref:Protein kinase domain-containing protein n=1 Tax=Taenia asiatica TaxID=60517 RepID=A0A0R3WD49_TAEAS|nr:unnamed protein product [Taenia asiatica]
MRKLVTFTIKHTNQYATATENSSNGFEESNVKDKGGYDGSKTVENNNRKTNKAGQKCHYNLTYDTVGEEIGTGDNMKLTPGSNWKALKKARLILEDLTNSLFKRVEIWSGNQSIQWITHLNTPQNVNKIRHHLPSWGAFLKSCGESKKDREFSYVSVKVPLHAEIVQRNSDDHICDNDSKDSGHHPMIVPKTVQQITTTYVMENVEPYSTNQHGVVDELEMNHSNSSQCGCNRSFTGMSHVQGLSTRGQVCPGPGRITNSCGRYSSGVQNATKCPSGSPIKSTDDFSKETDIKKIAASCIRRYTLEESKALATSPSMYTSDFCCPTQKSSETMKPAASRPGEQMSYTSKVPGQKVEGQAEFSQKPISSPKCVQNYPRMRCNESVTAVPSDGQCRKGSQGSSMCRPTKPQNDKCMGKFMGNFDDSIDFHNPVYPQSRSPMNMPRNPANRKSGRQSPCRIAITGCERPVVPSYRSPNVSNPEIDTKDGVSGEWSDRGTCKDMGKSTSRFLNAGENGGGCDGSSQCLTGGKKINRDCCRQSSCYPTSSSSKCNNTAAKDVSYDYLQSKCPQDSLNEDHESRYGAESCHKSSGKYSFQIKYTEVEEADSPSIQDAFENDFFGKPNQLRVRGRNHQSPNKSLPGSSCKTSSNPQYAGSKNLVDDYGRNEGEVGYQDCENIDGDNRSYPEDYYSSEPGASQFFQDESICGRIRGSRHAYEDPSAMMMQRYQQNHFIDASRSPPRPQHRCMEDMDRSSNWLGCAKDFECARCMPRAHSEECPSPYPMCKKASGFHRKRSRKRCVSRRQKCPGRPRKVVKLSRRASMELERRYAPQVHRSESSLACDVVRNNKCCTTKRRYSQPDSPFEEPVMSGENRKCLCRSSSSSSSRCVMVNPCYRNNRAAFLRKKFNEARIDEEDDPCCCVTLFRSTPMRRNNRSQCQFSESVEERDEGSLDCCMNGEQEEIDPCREPKTPRFRSPVSLNGCQPRERDTEVRKNLCDSNTPCLNIDVEGKQIMLKKFDNTTNCASSELTLPKNACGKNVANNDISIALGDKTIIIKNPSATDQVSFESKYGKWTSDSRSQSGSSCMDSVVSRRISSPKQRRRKSPCIRRCRSAAVRKRSTPLKLCSLKETSSYERSAGIKPSVCQPTVCVALDYVPNVQGPPSRALINKCCPLTKRAQPKSSSGFCPCTQISNGAMPCSKRPTIINSPTGSSPQSGGPRITPLRQWNAPPTRQPGSTANSNPRSKSPGGYNASSEGSQWNGRKQPGSSKVSGASGEPSKKTAPIQTSREEEGKGGDMVEKCTQCAKKMGFFARMCDKIKKKCVRASAQNLIDEEMNCDDDDGCGNAVSGSNCMRVNDTTSCSLRYNETRSHNCSACSTSRCVSNQSHSFMDLTEDPATNLQLTMRSCNNTASEAHSGAHAIEQRLLTISTCWCESEKMHCKTGQLQYWLDDYRMGSCSIASNTSARYCGIATQLQVTKYLCQEANLDTPSYAKPEIPTEEEIYLNLNGVCFCPNFPLLAFRHTIDNGFGEAKGPERQRNCHGVAPCPCYKASYRRCEVNPEIGVNDYKMKYEVEAVERSINTNNFPNRLNALDCCVISVGKEVPNIEEQKAASLQCFSRNSMSHFVHEPPKKPPHQGTTSAKSACVRLKRLDKPLFQTLNKPRYEVLALFKRPLAKSHANESMIHEPQKAKYLNPHCQPALRKVRTDTPTMKSKVVDTSSRWARMCAPYKKGSHTIQNSRNLEKLGEVDNRRFSATKSTDDFTCGRVESALLSPSRKTYGYVEVRPICKQPVVVKSPVKSKSGLNVPPCAKNWPQPMPKFQPASTRSSSFAVSHGNTLSSKPAFLPRNSAPSLHTQRSYGPVLSICTKASLNNMYPHSCRSSFDSKSVSPPYGGTGCGNCPRGENYLTRFSKLPPAPCQRVCSSEVANTHTRPIEVAKLKSAIAPEGKEEIPKPWQGSEKASAIKVSETPFITHFINASPLRSVSNSFGFSTPHENISVQPIKAVLQTQANSTVVKYTSTQCQNDGFLPNSRIAAISSSLHHRTSAMTNGFEPQENTDFELSTSLGQKKGEINQSRYSFQVEGRRFHVKVDKEGVFHVREIVKPPENLSFVTKFNNVVTNSEKSRPATNCVNSEQSAREIQSQASPSAQLEPESSEKSVEANENSIKCSTSRSKNSPIHEILRRSIKSLSGKLTPKFSCHANQQVGNSHTMTEEEKKSGSECEYFLPLTASEMSSHTDYKRIASKIFAADSPCNQNGHQAIFNHCRGTPRRNSSTNSQMLGRSVNVAVGSSYSDASAHRGKKKRVHSNGTSEDVNKPVLCTPHSNYKSGDCVEKTGSWADEGDCVVEDFDSYPQTKNSTLFSYACQSATETSAGISASMSMGEQLRLQVGYMDTSSKPTTLYHHFSLLDFSEDEEDSTRPPVETKQPIIRPNSAPLFLRKLTSPNQLFSNQATPEPALSNSDTDNIMETPFNEAYYDLQERKEAQTQVNLANRNNSALEESEVNSISVFYQKKSSDFSNQNNWLKLCHEQMTHPKPTTPWSSRLLPPLNDSLVCGDVKKVISVESRMDKKNEKSVAMLPVEIGKDDTTPPRDDDNFTESVNEASSNSTTEDPSLMSATLTLLLEGLCGTSGGTMGSRASFTRSERQQGNPKNKKRPYCMHENVWCASKTSSGGQNKSEGKRIESSARNCSKFKENKAFLLRKRQNCNHISVRCVTCLKKQKHPLGEPEMHFFAKGVFKHPFRKARRKGKRWTKDIIFKKISQCSRRSEARRRRRGHVTKPDGDRCYCANSTSRWRSLSRPKTRSHTSSWRNRLASFGIDTDGLGTNTSTECYAFQLLEPLEGIEQPSPGFTRCTFNPSMHQSKLFRQYSDVSAAPRSGSSNRYSRKHFTSSSSPKSRSLSMTTSEEDEDDREVGNSAKLSNSNFTFSRPHDTAHAPRALSHTSSSRPDERQGLMGDCMVNGQPLCLRMKDTLPIWNVKASTPPLLIVPSSGSQSDESPFVSSAITSLNTSETGM